MKTTPSKNLLKKTLLAGITSALALGAFTASADYASTVSGLNPLGYWRLNEPTQPVVPVHPLTNSSTAGASLNGSYLGVPLLGQPGALTTDTAVNLNGVSQFAEVPYAASLNPSGAFSVEFWANITNDTAGAKSGVVSRYISGSIQQGYLFFANNGNTTWQFRVYNGTGNTTVTSATEFDLLPDTWYHVVGVYDGSQSHIYVNGLGTSSASTTVVSAPNTNAPLRIGAGTTETNPTLFFPGLIDEVAVYPTALTPTQVSAHYTTALSNPAGYSGEVLALNPSGYWRLNEPTVPPYIPYAATNAGSLGSAQNGVYIGGATSGVAGPLGGQFAGFESDNKSVGLNGASGYISVPGFATTTDTATILGWIKRNGNQINASPILLQRADGSPATGLVVDFNNRLGYVWNDDAGSYSWNPGPSVLIPDGIWTFAALTISPTEATIYMGSTTGLVSVTRPGTYTHFQHDFNNGSVQLGRDGTSGTRLIKGNLDEVALFGTTLDATSISNLFYSSTPAILNVVRTPANPVFEGVDLTFTASAVSSAPINYQWRKNGSPVGGNSSVLTLSNVSPANDGTYDLVVTSGGQSVTSVVDTITVVAGPPVILTQPASGTRYEGSRYTFSVLAGGSTPFSYQWFKGVDTIADATNASYTIQPVTPTDAGDYSVQVTNPNGATNSAAATLTVLPLENDYSPLVLAAGAERYWRLDETSGTIAFDYAGGANGTHPGPTAVVVGVDGPRPPGQAGFEAGNTAYQLDGLSGVVTSPALNWNTNTVTFMAWVNLDAYPGDLGGVVFSRGASACGMDIRSTGELRYHWAGGQWGFSSGLTVPLNTWVFVALVVEPDRGTLYLGTPDGLASAENSTTHPVDPLSDPLRLGHDQGSRYIPGRIDEAAVYKRALTPGEISSLFGVGSGIPLELALTPGGIIEDTKPSGTPHPGVNLGSTWEASVTDGNSATRSGVARFATATPSQIVTEADPDFDSKVGTFSFWIRAAAPIPGPGDEAAIIMDRRTSAGTVITMDDAGSIFVQCAGGANSFFAGYVPDGNWHHVAVTYNQDYDANMITNGFVGIYIDGTWFGDNPNTAAWSWPVNQQLELGKSHDGYWKRLDGDLDDFRIYNRVLTAQEIDAIRISDAPVDSGALMLRYNFDNAGVGLTVSWPFGTLESSPALGTSADWTPVPGATPPSYPLMPTEDAKFFRATP